jgi:hypothetical protein
MFEAKISSLGLLFFTVVALGCVDPRCPKGYSQKGGTCYRIKGAGAIDAGDEELDGGEVDLEAGDVADDATDVDTTTDHRDAGADTGDPVDALPAGNDASLDPCQGSGGTAVCIGTMMYHCSPQGVTESSDTCATAQQCQLGIAGDRCPPCAPGKFQCLGARLERCSNDGSGWELLTNCDSEALCNETAGACTDKACTPSTRVCSGDTLNGCNTSLTAFVPIMTCDAGLCDQAQGQCDVCIANAKECDQDTVVTCSADGQMATRSPCTQPTPKCTGAGRCVQCIGNADCIGEHELCMGNSCVVQPYCGDGRKDPAEECDPSVPGENAWVCSAQCKPTTAYTWCGRNLTDGQGQIVQGVGCATGELCLGGICTGRCNLIGDCSVPPTGTVVCGTAQKFCIISDCAAASDCAPGLVCVPQSGGGGVCLGCSDTYRCPSGTCKLASPGDTYRKCLP